MDKRYNELYDKLRKTLPSKLSHLSGVIQNNYGDMFEDDYITTDSAREQSKAFSNEIDMLIKDIQKVRDEVVSLIDDDIVRFDKCD